MDLGFDLIKEIRKRVLDWYSRNARPLPWRKTKDPYKIWLCEIIFQQTRIEQGISYYLHILKTFPTLRHLALADETQVLKVWEGLGYYSRAQNLLKTAKIVYQQYGGFFPQTYEELLKLPGVGPYTGAAIGSICFNLPVPTIDGNVRRVLARIFEIRGTSNSTSFIKTIQQLAEQMVSKKSPGNFNQGIMDIGSTICVPMNPKCGKCPLKDCCLAYQHGTQNHFPQKKGIRPVSVLHWAVGIIICQGKILITREEHRNFLKNLYALPTVDISTMIDSDSKHIFSELALAIKLPHHLKWNFLFQSTRKYSHRIIHFYVYQSQLKTCLGKIPSPYHWVSLKEIDNYPFSRAYTDIIRSLK